MAANLTDSSPSRLWTRDYVLQLVSAFFWAASLYLLLPAIPLYVTDILRGSATDVGMLTTVASLSALVARLVGGWGCDRWGRRLAQVAALVLFTLATFGYHLARSIGAMQWIRLLYGIPLGVITSVAVTVTSDLVPEARRGEGIGNQTIVGTAALMIFPLLAFPVLDRAGYGGLFWLAGGLCIVSLGAAWAVRYLPVRDATVRFGLSGMVEKRVAGLAWMEWLVALGYGGSISFISLWAEQIGVANPGSFFALYAVGIIIVRIVVGRLYDRRGPTLPLVGGLVLLAAGYLALASTTAAIGYYVGAAVFGAGIGAVLPSLTTMAVSMVPPARRGAAGATALAGFDIGMVIGPLLGGWLASLVGGYRGLFVAAALFTVAPVVLYFARVRSEYEGHRR